MYYMQRTLLFPFIIMLLLIVPLSAQETAERPQVLVETSRGRFVLELYHETPIHRDNFLRHVQQGDYEGVQFHRVISGFMIQGGNLLSRELEHDAELPDDSVSGTLPAEILFPRFFHERGALAAARTANEVNPERRSSASQFYIVTGQYLTDYDLAQEVSKRPKTYNETQREAYKYQGGAPHLDGEYTIFGRLIDGWRTVDKIQHVEVNDDDRPRKPITIRRMTLLEGKKRIKY